MDEYERKETFSVANLSIIVAATDGRDYTKQCLEWLLPEIIPGEMEVIVVDDASTDGTAELLVTMPHIMIISRSRRQGATAAFNRGFQEATGQEILFLHNDTVLPPGTIGMLRKVLESDMEWGAVSPMSGVSNSIYNYMAAKPYQTIDELFAVAREIAEKSGHWNIRQAMVLDDFCLLVRREAFLRAGGFDERFSPRYFAAEDLSLRLWQTGYKLATAMHVFVHHTGQRRNDLDGPAKKWYEENEVRFQEKWGFLPRYSLNVNDVLLNHIDFRQPSFSVLDVGCAGGGNLMRVRELRPESERYGIELNEGAAKIASLFGEVDSMDVTKLDRPAWEGKFSYIFCGDLIEHLAYPLQVLKMIGRFLKPGTGKLLVSLPNVLNYTVWKEMLTGQWTYRSQGILDRTHLRFFTRESGLALLREAGLDARIVDHNEMRNVDLESLEPMIEHLLQTPGATITRGDIIALQWIIEAWCPGE